MFIEGATCCCIDLGGDQGPDCDCSRGEVICASPPYQLSSTCLWRRARGELSITCYSKFKLGFLVEIGQIGLLFIILFPDWMTVTLISRSKLCIGLLGVYKLKIYFMLVNPNHLTNPSEQMDTKYSGSELVHKS